MYPAYLAASLLHAIFAIVIVSVGNSPLLTLTSRRQFDDWPDLLDAYRKATSINDTKLLGRALSLAWCNTTLPPYTTRAPYCGCVEKTHAKFRNNTLVTLEKARDDAAMGLVRCLGDRAVWKVSPVWGVRFATPAVYVFFIAACFMWIAAEVPLKQNDIPIFALMLILIIFTMVSDFLHNSFWAFMFVLVAVIIDLILIPGMAIPLEPPLMQQENRPLVLQSNSLIQRTPSCFWWAEYLSAPVFALYVPLMHCGRDLFFFSVFTMIGTAVGGLGLRSFYCSQAYSEVPKNQFKEVMQFIVWLGILASCVSLSFLTGIYYNSDVPYFMGPGSVALLSLTFLVSIMQWPGNQDYQSLLMSQMTLALVRNTALFGLVLTDLLK